MTNADCQLNQTFIILRRKVWTKSKNLHKWIKGGIAGIVIFMFICTRVASVNMSFFPIVDHFCTLNSAWPCSFNSFNNHTLHSWLCAPKQNKNNKIVWFDANISKYKSANSCSNICFILEMLTFSASKEYLDNIYIFRKTAL